MLMRYAIGYFGSAVIQTATGIGAIALLTRLLSETEYGLYALSAAVLPLAGSVLYFWARAGVSRHLAGAQEAGHEATYLATIRLGFGVMTAVGVAVGGLAIWLAPVAADARAMLWVTLAACVLQGALLVNLEVHRARLEPFRYFWLMSLQSAVGFGLTVAAVTLTDWGAAGAVAGIAASCVLCLAVDRSGRRVWLDRTPADRRRFRAIVIYGLPITLTTTIDSYMGTGDRLVLTGLVDLAAIGAYAAAQTLANRSLLVVASAIGSASVPLAVSALARDGVETARHRLKAAAELMLALLVPMTLGLGWLAEPVADLMIGEGLREATARLLPWLAVAASLNGLTGHYVNHAFQLSEKPLIEMLAILPAAIVGLIGLLTLVPRYGIDGAAAAALATQVVYFGLSVMVARRVFTMPIPWVGLIKIALATAAMAGALALLPPPQGTLALFGAIGVGAIVYGIAAAVLDIADAHGLILRRWQNLRRRI